jgi:hypothetical protein
MNKQKNLQEVEMGFLEMPAKHGNESTKGSNGGLVLLPLEVSGVFERVSPCIFYTFSSKKKIHRLILAPLVFDGDWFYMRSFFIPSTAVISVTVKNFS